jgi:hypothetical protein
MLIAVPDGAPTPKLPSVSLRPRSRNGGHNEIGVPPLGGASASPDADGILSLRDVHAGDYAIFVTDPPWPYYLDAVRVGEVEASPEQVELLGPVSITLVYKTNGGTVRGKATKCGAGKVVLVSCPSDSISANSACRIGVSPSEWFG